MVNYSYPLTLRSTNELRKIIMEKFGCQTPTHCICLCSIKPIFNHCLSLYKLNTDIICVILIEALEANNIRVDQDYYVNLFIGILIKLLVPPNLWFQVNLFK